MNSAGFLLGTMLFGQVENPPPLGTFFTISASAGSHGTISPAGSVVKASGTDAAFSITPDPGYRVSQIVVDGVSVGAFTTYTFSRIAAPHTISATFALAPPFANFTGTPMAGAPPLIVIFTDSSTNAPTSWLWNFGDGDSTNATVKNPVHRYANTGTYNVSLTATNAAGSNMATRMNYITVSSSAPVAGFTGTPTSGTNPLTVVFTDSSTNTPTSWLWNFGDSDSTNATVKNPVHRYANMGTYTVSLTATNAGGSNTSTRTGYIVVNRPIIPASRVLLNSQKTSDLVSGGYIQFTSRGSNSNLIHKGVSYTLKNNDVVRLTINSDTRGQMYANGDQLSQFSFDDVGLTINGVDYGRGTISSIYFQNTVSQSSTLALVMPSQNAWTQLIVDGTTIFSGDSSAPVTVYGLWNSPTGTMNLNNQGTTYYDGPATGYSIT
jgi:PKD repeat protein